MRTDDTTAPRWARIGEVALAAVVPPALPVGAGEVESSTSIYSACPNCTGTGYYLEAVPFGHPQFGKLKPCQCTIARQRTQHRAELERLSNLHAFEEQRFATFDPDIPGVRKAYLRALDFAQQPRGWLLLFGSYGVGKTHLAAAAAHEVLQRGEQVLFTVVPDLLDHLRATFGPSSEVAYDARFEIIRAVPLLVLDDLGTESATAWAREKLYQIINHRYNAQLPTIITSNRSLETFDGRITSRMLQRAFNHEVLRINAADYRGKQIRGGVAYCSTS